MFYRASNVTNIKGTGLGLHIVKRYPDLVNGTTFAKHIGKWHFHNDNISKRYK